MHTYKGRIHSVRNNLFPDASAALSEGLRALAENDDTELDAWLRREVAPTYDRVKSGASPLLSASEVFDGLEARYRARKAAPSE